jgi:hypothetical protein
MFQTKVVEKIKTHILCSVTFFSFENRAVYEIMWKNAVEPDRPQMTWRKRTACWITKATNTHSEYAIIIALSLQQWLHGRTSMLRYTCTACLVMTERVFTERYELELYVQLTFSSPLRGRVLCQKQSFLGWEILGSVPGHAKKQQCDENPQHGDEVMGNVRTK